MNGAESSRIGDIILIVIGGLAILGGGVTAYMAYSDTEAINAEIATKESELSGSESKLRDLNSKAREITNAVGWGGKEKILDELSAVGSLNAQAKFVVENYSTWVPADKQELLKKEWKFAVKEDGSLEIGADQNAEPTSVGVTAKDLLLTIKEVTKNAGEETKNKNAARDAARQREVSVIGEDGKGGKLAEESTKWNNANEELVRQIKGVTERIVNTQTEKMRQISSLESAIATVQDQMSQTRVESETKVNELRRKGTEVKDRINKLEAKEEQVAKTFEWDGTILTVDLPAMTFYADIGKESGLFRGTDFDIYGLEKGGKRIRKGQAEVLEVLDDMCKLAITQMVDQSVLPIRPGDKLHNDLFDPGKTKLFAFAGRFVGKYGTNDAAKLIEERGGRVFDDVTLGTSYCVIGEGFQNHPNYLRAKELGVIIIREKELYDLLGIK